MEWPRSDGSKTWGISGMISDDDGTCQYSGEEGDDNESEEEEVVEDDEMEVGAPDEGADIEDLFDSEIARARADLINIDNVMEDAEVFYPADAMVEVDRPHGRGRLRGGEIWCRLYAYKRWESVIIIMCVLI